ncbi:MAG: NADH-quinone oxidoreductase subunit L [Fibrobacteres bacterium]|nr:NADH-quinone oxidoreductase subunit L [Fibrobacterota bacterium]
MTDSNNYIPNLKKPINKESERVDLQILFFLIGFPLIPALLSLISPKSVRGPIVVVSSLILVAVSIYLTVINFTSGVKMFKVDNIPHVGTIMLAIEVLLGIFLIVQGLRYKKWLIPVLVAAQVGLMIWFETGIGHGMQIANDLFIDKFTLIMNVIIGVVGSLIAIYGVGYMKEHHEEHHPEAKDSRGLFFFIIFVFLSAMFGVVFSNNLMWLYFFWEITTISSFLLIGYKGDEVSKNNAFRALTYNLLGGLGFALGLVIMFKTTGIMEMDKLLACGKGVAVLPIALLAFAGMTKSAQMPFSSWLLGAMVAPTPVSALLHSSTMVKAGVYLIVKLSPVLAGTFTGTMVAFVGMFTFLATSLLATSQSDAKKILAYSTIANLGLIVACGGVGTFEAVWAGILLIIFHAVTKALLFLCVGAAEHELHSRNVESMDGIVKHMPKIAWMLLIGMAGMFLAPFGMLISKWAVLRAFVDSNILLAVILAFGSAATLFFWVKWMGKLVMVTYPKEQLEKNLKCSVTSALYVLAIMTIAITALFPLMSSEMIEPYLVSVFGMATTLGKGNIIIMLIMLGLLAIFPFSLPGKNCKCSNRVVDPYLSGANTDGGHKFRNSFCQPTEFEAKNYYLEKFFGEKALFTPSVVISIALLITLFVGVIK